MRALAVALLLCAGCAAPPTPSPGADGVVEEGGFAAARVGDRVDLRFELQEVRAGAALRVSFRAFVEVVKRDPEVQTVWVRLGVRDAQGDPVGHPTVFEDLLVLTYADVERAGVAPPSGVVETLEVGGARLPCAVTLQHAEGPSGGVARTWSTTHPALYLVHGRARRTFTLYSDGGDFTRTTFEVVDHARGAGPALGDLAAPVLFPGSECVTRGAAGLELHRLRATNGRLAYDVRPLVAAPDGPRVIDGARYADPPPFDPEQVTTQQTLVELLEGRALAAARGEPETDPMLSWRDRVPQLWSTPGTRARRP